jgi:hypothetical protein
MPRHDTVLPCAHLNTRRQRATAEQPNGKMLRQENPEITAKEFGEGSSGGQ